MMVLLDGWLTGWMYEMDGIYHSTTPSLSILYYTSTRPVTSVRLYSDEKPKHFNSDDENVGFNKLILEIK